MTCRAQGADGKVVAGQKERMNNLAIVMFAAAVATAGCAAPKTAIVDGKKVPRLTLEFTGNPYSIKHDGAHPRPGGPSSGLRDAGGGIRGRVCGMLVDFDVTHKGDHVQLVGSIDNQWRRRSTSASRTACAISPATSVGSPSTSSPGPAIMEGHVGIRVFAIEGGADNALPRLHAHPRPARRQRRQAAHRRHHQRAQGAVGDAGCRSGGGAARDLHAAARRSSASSTRSKSASAATATDRPPETSAVYTKM